MAIHPWICTWLSTSQPTSGDAFPMPLEISVIDANQTLQQTLRISLGGDQLRLVFSNRYGTQPLILGQSHIKIVGHNDEEFAVTFNGQNSAAIPAGEIIYSDVIAVKIPALSEIELSTFLPESINIETFHWDARHYSTLLPNHQKISSRLLLENVEVRASTELAQSIVVIGDSMVDGNSVAIDHYGRWTDFLAEKTVQYNIGIINAGQSGSRLLKDGIGISTLARFERDVLNQTGVTACIVQIGLNDLGLAGTALDALSEVPTAEKLINGYRHLIQRAKVQGIRIVGVTLVPLRSQSEYGLDNFYQPEKEVIRQTVNHWMRTNCEFDAFIDADLLVRDPQCIELLNMQYDSGDHLHLNEAGQRLIADSISVQEILLGVTKTKA